MQAAGGTAHAIALLGGIRSLRGVHNAQNAACASAAALASGLDERAIQRGLWSFPGSRPSHGRDRSQGQCSVCQQLQGDQRRLHGTGAGLLSRTCSGLPAARRRTGGIASLARFFPRIRKAYLIGEAAPDVRGDTRRASCERGRRAARSCRDAGGEGCGSLRPDGCGRAAVAGLCVV